MTTHRTKSKYLAEIRWSGQNTRDLEWIGRSLDAACRRLRGANRPQVIGAGYSPEERRLVCVVQAANREVVRRLFEIAPLPSARILDLVEVGRIDIRSAPDEVSVAPPVPPSSRSAPEN
jgi:hypothetical protein